MTSPDYPDYVPGNVAVWTKSNAEHTDAAAEEAWTQAESTWGRFEVPES